MENINYHDFLNMCRTCSLDIDLKPIEDNTIIEILQFIPDINYKKDDELPQQICGTCIKKINEINTFLLQCKSTDSTLKKYLVNLKNECESATIDSGKKPLEIYVVEPMQIKEEVTTDDNNHESINFENIIKDMRKEFDVVPSSDPLNLDQICVGPNTDNPDQIDEVISLDSDVEENTTNKKQNKCGVCNKTFAASSSLNRHKRLHSNDNPYKCNKCLKIFSESSHLIKHDRIHLGIKPYKCQMCKKTFTEMGQLNRHKRTHTGLKPYECTVCSKTFGNSSGLVKHKRIHTGLKPYKCQTCAKTFRTSSQLLTHKTIHANVFAYKCDVCAKEFKSDDNLKKHKLTHSGVKYKCTNCGKMFLTINSLNKHNKTINCNKKNL